MIRVTLAVALAAAALLAPGAQAYEVRRCVDTRVLLDGPYFDGCAAVYESVEGGPCITVYGDVNGIDRRLGCVA